MENNNEMWDVVECNCCERLYHFYGQMSDGCPYCSYGKPGLDFFGKMATGIICGIIVLAVIFFGFFY